MDRNAQITETLRRLAARILSEGKAGVVPNHLRDRHRPGSDTYGIYLRVAGGADPGTATAADAYRLVAVMTYLPPGVTPILLFTTCIIRPEVSKIFTTAR